MTIASLTTRSLQWLRKKPLRAVTAIACACSAIYWLGIASDRYVSESRLIIQSTNLHSGSQIDLGSLISGASGGNRTDQLLLREHLRSPDMAEKLDEQLQLRQHFAGQGDWFSRLWSAEASAESFYDYYLRRVAVEFDEFAGVLVLKAQAYEPEIAQRINQALLKEGERFMNQLAHAIAQ